VLQPFQEFAESEAFGGMVLLACALVALAWANSPWRDSYVALWKFPVSVGPASAPLTLSLHHWVDDGLMAVFFLLVGLEIKREFLVGELASPQQAALPIAGALGGVLLPALLYALMNRGGEGARGWGIPMATDIAFALAVVRLLGDRVPYGLSMFLAALAIVAWAATGPLFNYSDTWQLVINTGTTIVTFLMVFIIQNTQNRDGSAIQAKLDELIRSNRMAQNSFIGIEHLTEDEIEEYKKSCAALAKKAADRVASKKKA